MFNIDELKDEYNKFFEENGYYENSSSFIKRKKIPYTIEEELIKALRDIRASNTILIHKYETSNNILIQVYKGDFYLIVLDCFERQTTLIDLTGISQLLYINFCNNIIENWSNVILCEETIHAIKYELKKVQNEIENESDGFKLIIKQLGELWR